MNKTYKKYIFNFIIIVLFALGAIYFSVKDNFVEIMGLIKNINIVYFLIILAISLLPFFIEGIILTTLARIHEKKFKVIDGIGNTFVGAFFSGITPFASGGQFLQTYVFVKHGLTMTSAISVLLMDFLIYQTTLVIYTLIVLILRYTTYAARLSSIFSLSVLGFLVNFVVISMLLLAANSKKVQYFLTDVALKFLSKLRIIKDYEERKIALETKIHQFSKEIKVLFKNKRVMITTSLLSVCRLTVMFSIPYFAMWALDANLGISIFECICLTAFIYMITAFIPIPGASGGSEGTYVLLFSAFVSKALASSSMLVWRFITYYLIISIGAFIFLFYYKKESNQSKKQN